MSSRQLITTIALALSVLVGFAMPMGDAAIAAAPVAPVSATAEQADATEPGGEVAAEMESGDLIETQAFAATPFESSHYFTSVAAGETFSLALTNDGQVLAWGEGDLGQLGDGLATSSDTPVQLETAAFGGERVAQVSAGRATAYALTESGSVFAWGAGVGAQLGVADGAATSPVQLDAALFGGESVAELAASGDNAFTRTSGGQVYAWDAAVAPRLLGLASAAAQIAAGTNSSFAAALDSGEVFAGAVTSDATNLVSVGAEAVAGAPTDITVSSGFVNLLTDAGAVYAAGAGDAFAEVAGVAGAHMMASGDDYSLAIAGDGPALVSWTGAGEAQQVDLSTLEGAVPASVAVGPQSAFLVAGGAIYSLRAEPVEGEGEELPPLTESEEPGLDEGLKDEPELGQLQSRQAPSLISEMLTGGIMPLAAGATGCDYATPGTGAYAESLCWFDLSGFSTQYIQTARSNTACTGNGNLTTPYKSTVTLTYGPQVAGSASPNFTRAGAGESSGLFGAGASCANAQADGYTKALNALENDLHRNGNTFYGNITNWPVEISLPGGFTLTAKLSTTGSANNETKTIAATAFPTWNDGPSKRAFLGTGNFYTGVDGKPALYNLNNASGNTVIKLDSIELKDSQNQSTKNYTIVGADAESTDNGESINWATTGAGFQWLPNTPSDWTLSGTDTDRKLAAIGNACSATPNNNFAFQNTPTTSRSCTTNSSQESRKTGTVMLQTAPHPTNATFGVTQTLNFNTTKSKQGVAFGVIFARAEIKVTVTDRILDILGGPSVANFGITATTGQSQFNVQTGAILNTNSLTEGIPVGVGGTQLSFASAATGVNASSYTVSWQCSKSNPLTGAMTYWPGPGQNVTSPSPPLANAAFTKVQAGEVLKCEAEYTPPYLTLEKQVTDPAGTGATNLPEHWNLTAAGTNSAFMVPGGPATATVRKPIAVGNDYALTEAGPTTNLWQHGYAWRDLTCVRNPASTTMATDALQVTRDVNKPNSEAGEVTGATLKVAKGNDLLCTYKNEARNPNLKVEKTASPVTRTVVAENTDLEYTLTFDNSTGTFKDATGYQDHLDDVLDDADLLGTSGAINNADPKISVDITPEVTHDVVAVYDPATKLINITGDVPAYAKVTVKFSVKIKPNTENAADRNPNPTLPSQANPTPTKIPTTYVLNNYLVKNGTTVPSSCLPSNDTCTYHPISAWNVTKRAQPTSGLTMNKTGAPNYTIIVNKSNPETPLTGVTVTDDLTDLLRVATWNRDINPPSPALPLGIYFYDQNNNLTRSITGTAAEAVLPNPVYDDAAGKWTLTTEPFDLAPGEFSAHVRFSVQLGVPEPAPSGSTTWNPGPVEAGMTFTNYGKASSASAPNRCDVLVANGDLPAACVTTHTLTDNTVTFRKDGIVTNMNGTRGKVEDLVGHEFLIYKAGPGGELTSDLPDNQCAVWNSSVVDPNDQPNCWRFYAIDAPGQQQDGRWRSSNLSAGSYWLVETKAPTHRNNDGTLEPVSNVQLLVEPIPFRVASEADANPQVPIVNGQPGHLIRGQLDVFDSITSASGTVRDRCDTGTNWPTACVNPTGYLMIVSDVKLPPLPLTGGVGAGWLIGGGAAMFALILGAAWWRRRKHTLQTNQTSQNVSN